VLWIIPLSLKNDIRAAFEYIQFSSSAGIQTAKAIRSLNPRIISKSKLISLCEDLIQENSSLRLQLSINLGQLEEHFPDEKMHTIGNFMIKPAKVIRRDMATWSNELLINIGTVDGILNGMGVISQNCVIGRIKTARAKTSIVELITSPQFRMVVHAAKDAEGNPIVFSGDETNAFGHAMGNATSVPANIAENDEAILLVTSELSGIFPKNIAIGTVNPPREIVGNSFSAAAILNDKLLSRLYEVAVLIPMENQ
jgi:cell shape-determining protein MreC